MTNTEQVRNYLKYYKAEADDAERTFDQRSRHIQEMSSEKIDLFGGHAISQTADIVKECQRTCEDLYASYQTIVKMVDEKCRPLLTDELETIAIKEVADFLQMLNDESEIDNDFAASFNAAHHREIATVHFSPAIESRMIQKYWKSAYFERPDRVEAEKKQKQNQEKEKQKELENRRKEFEEKQAKYEKDYEVWKLEYERVSAQRKEWISKQILCEKEIQIQNIQHSLKMKQQREKDNYKLAQTRVKLLSSLSANTLLSKKTSLTLKESLNEANVRLNKIEMLLTQIEEQDRQQISVPDETMKKFEEKFTVQAEAIFPCPEKPHRPFNPFTENANPTRMQLENTEYKEYIYSIIEKDGPCTINDISNKHPELDLTNQRLTSLLTSLYKDGYLSRYVEKRQAYFSVNTEEQVDGNRAKTVSATSGSSRKPTQMQIENERQKKAICTFLETNGTCTVSNLMERCPELRGLTNARVTSLVTSLYRDGIIDRTVENHMAYFSLNK